ELADFLDHDAQSFSSGRAAGSRTDSDGNRRARSPRERQASNSAENALALSNQDRKARRLSRPRQRSSPGNTVMWRGLSRRMASDLRSSTKHSLRSAMGRTRAELEMLQS